jgi:hypothetical protein
LQTSAFTRFHALVSHQVKTKAFPTKPLQQTPYQQQLTRLQVGDLTPNQLELQTKRENKAYRFLAVKEYKSSNDRFYIHSPHFLSNLQLPPHTPREVFKFF